MNETLLASELKRDESLRMTVYDDATGKALNKGSVIYGHATIGVGRALDVRGITRDEAYYLLKNDITSFTLGLQQAYTWFNGLSDTRQRVLMNMAFNMGLSGIGEFHDMLRYISEGRFDLAAKAMQDSHWYTQVGDRAKRLVAMMISGVDA